jgi:hypothetical protein
MPAFAPLPKLVAELAEDDAVVAEELDEEEVVVAEGISEEEVLAAALLSDMLNDSE